MEESIDRSESRGEKLTHSELALIALDEMLGFPDLHILAEAIRRGTKVFDVSEVDSSERVCRAIRLREQLPEHLIGSISKAVQRFTR